MAGVIPDPADLDADLIRAAELLQHLLEDGTDVTDPLDTDVEAITTNSVWPGNGNFRDQALATRIGFSNFIQARIRALFDPIFLAYLRVAKKDAAQIDVTTFRDVYEYIRTSSRLVKRRNPTFDSSPTTGGTGSLTWRRLTTDWRGHVIEAIWSEDTDVTAEIVEPTAPKHEPTLKFRTEPRIDLFSIAISGESHGDGVNRFYKCKNSDNEFLTDASMEFAGAATAAGSLTSLGAWKDETGSSLARIAIINDGYRPSVREFTLNQLDSTAPSMQCIRIATASGGGDIDISQLLRPIQKYTAYDGGVWIRKQAGTTGTFTLVIGGVTVTQDVSLLSNNTWTFIGLPLNANNWWLALETTNAKYRLSTSSISGTFDIDAAEFGPMFRHNGVYWNPVPSSTALLNTYTAVFEDSIGTDSVVQKLIFYGYGFDYWLPSDASPSAGLVETGI